MRNIKAEFISKIPLGNLHKNLFFITYLSQQPFDIRDSQLNWVKIMIQPEELILWVCFQILSR